MTREEAINKVRQMSLPKETMDILEALAPELTMSEDEMMIYELQGFLSSFGSDYFGTGEWQKFDNWLEKQKEHHLELKAGKWYICYRAFCARADDLTVKEGERFQCEKDGIVKGFVIKEPEKYFIECSAPAPMEKEQKPVDFPTTDEEVNEFLETHPKVEVPEKYKTPDFVFSKQEYESHPIISKDTTSVKPVEWSEEDEDMLNCCISSIEEAKENRYAYKETDGDTSYDREIDWLKSLRPQPHTVSIKNATKFGNLEYERGVKDGIQSEKSHQWKPSEEQMQYLLAVINEPNNAGSESCHIILKSLYNDLKKLYLWMNQ